MKASRRNFLRWTGAGGLAAAVGAISHGQNPAPKAPGDSTADFITSGTEAAIEGGLAFLARVQNPDGSFADRLSGAAVGITALAGLALMAGGHLPGKGRHGRTVSRALDFVLATGSRGVPGFLATNDGQPGFGNQQLSAYSHGFGSLFLAELCGMLPDRARQKQVKNMLELAVAYTVEARNREGGWRYEPRPSQADVSVTVAQMMALRAAKNAGVFVRKNVIDDGVAFIRACQNPDGGFNYFKQGISSEFARSAAAIVGLNSAGIYSGREIERGLRYVMQFIPVRQFNNRDLMRQQKHYYYGHYYAALAMWTAGGDYWSQWFPAIRDELLSRARASGGVWSDPIGQAYATAMSLIILQLPNNYLPILQK